LRSVNCETSAGFGAVGLGGATLPGVTAAAAGADAGTAGVEGGAASDGVVDVGAGAGAEDEDDDAEEVDISDTVDVDVVDVELEALRGVIGGAELALEVEVALLAADCGVAGAVTGTTTTPAPVNDVGL
jgi:hypothetical protein